MKKEIDIGFVILHYKTDEQTKNCVDSIIKYINKKYIITIVDNYSNNGSIEKLEEEYKNNNNNIKIIKSNSNLGFARGNNIGIKWINENYNTKYIAVINNDTQILDDNFYNIVDNEYNKSKFAVMGPKIRLLHNKINPLCNQEISIKRCYERNKYIRKQIFIKTFYLDSLVKLMKKYIKKRKKGNKNQLDPDTYYKNIILHGCFLIFSMKYFNEYDGFNDRTFLYHEEELLYLRLKKKNLVSIYNPNLIIFHEEDASTNYSLPNERKRALFKLKNIYKSNQVLIDELKRMENE